MLSELFYPHGSGGELATYLYAKLLKEAGVNVIVVTNRFSGEPNATKSGNMVIYRLPLFDKTESVKFSILLRGDIFVTNFMRKLMKWADIIYIPKFWYSAIPYAKAYKKPVMVHLHGYAPVCPVTNLYNVSKWAICSKQNGLCSLRCVYSLEKSHNRRLIRSLTSGILNLGVHFFLKNWILSADAIICVSEFQRNQIISHNKALLFKIFRVYNPIPDIPYIKVEGNDFGYFGGPSYLKGFHILLKALHLIRRFKCKTMRVHATKFIKSNKKEFVESLNNMGILTYGRLDNYQYNNLYRHISVVIVPSVWYEPLPYVVTEAILRGRLVIASNIGGIPEQTKDCRGAFLIEAGNHEKLAETMEYLSGIRRETVMDFGLHDREVILRRYDNKVILREFLNICENFELKG